MVRRFPPDLGLAWQVWRGQLVENTQIVELLISLLLPKVSALSRDESSHRKIQVIIRFLRTILVGNDWIHARIRAESLQEYEKVILQAREKSTQLVGVICETRNVEVTEVNWGEAWKPLVKILQNFGVGLWSEEPPSYEDRSS